MLVVFLMESTVKFLILINLHPDKVWLSERAYLDAERAVETRNLMNEIPKYQSIDEYFEVTLTPIVEEKVDEPKPSYCWDL